MIIRRFAAGPRPWSPKLPLEWRALFLEPLDYVGDNGQVNLGSWFDGAAKQVGRTDIRCCCPALSTTQRYIETDAAAQRRIVGLV
jgi:hypothetical protein